MQAFFAKYWKQILTVIVVIIILLVLFGGWNKLMVKIRRWQYERNASAGGDGFDAYPLALKIYNAIDGLGTDESAIFSTLEGKSDEQLAAIYNEFGNILAENNEQGDLLSWLNDDLSGDQLARALAYFEGVNFN